MLSERSFTLATSNDQTLFIIDGTRVNDVRIYEDEIAPTVISRYGTGGGNVPAVFPIQGTIIGRSDTAGPQGKGYGNENDPMFTIDTVGGHGVAIMGTLTASNNPSRSPQSSEVTQQIAKVYEAISTVRRLTPTECERLQGFPDGWTSKRFDEKKGKVIEQADSARYKQMGNAVAVPVVDWLVSRLVAHA